MFVNEIFVIRYRNCGDLRTRWMGYISKAVGLPQGESSPNGRHAEIIAFVFRAALSDLTVATIPRLKRKYYEYEENPGRGDGNRRTFF